MFLPLCAEPDSAPFPLADPANAEVGAKQRHQFGADPRGDGTFAINGPGEHRAAVEVLDQTGEHRSVTPAKFAGGNGLVEKTSSLFTDGAKLRKSDGVKI